MKTNININLNDPTQAQKASSLIINPNTRERGYIYYLTQQNKYIFVTEKRILQKCPQKDNWLYKHLTVLTYDKNCFN